MHTMPPRHGIALPAGLHHVDCKRQSFALVQRHELI
jgi:hypothetical protein